MYKKKMFKQHLLLENITILCSLQSCQSSKLHHHLPSWQHQAPNQNLAERTEEDEEPGCTKDWQQGHSRDSTLAHTGYKSCRICKSHHGLCMFTREKHALKLWYSSWQAAPAVRRELTRQGQWQLKAAGPSLHTLTLIPALAPAANLISPGTGRGKAGNEDMAILLCPWQAAAAQGNSPHHLCSQLVLLWSQFSVMSSNDSINTSK